MANVAPSGTNATISTGTSYKLKRSNFGFSDTDSNSFLAVKFTTLPTTGTLYYDSNGDLGGNRSVVTAGQLITIADIMAGKVTFVAAGTSSAALTFQVQDNGGTGGGGVDLDQSPNTLTINPTAAQSVNTLFGTSINLAGLGAADGFKIQGSITAGFLGGSVASAGDINGDGYADIIVGAAGGGQDANANPINAGTAYVVFGKASGFSPVSVTTLTGTTGFAIVGETAGDQAAASVSSAGDINNDGYDDIIIGAPQNSSQKGAAYVVFGKASGFGTINLSSVASGVGGFKISGELATADYLGRSVAPAGDVNGDGFNDIIVGANSQGANNNGAAYIIFGKASGFASINLASLPASSGFKITGETGADYLGRSVSAGDINGDGISDIIVGAYHNSSAGRSQNGAVYVVFGKVGLASVSLSALNGTNGFKILGESTLDYEGYVVSSAGDINGDGFADIIVGRNDYYNHSSNHAGAAYVVFGKASGFGATIDLAALNGTNGFKISGQAAVDYAGISVSSAGDVNGDGYADLLVGADRNDTSASNAGATYVLFGKASGFGNVDLNSIAATSGFKILGEAAADQEGRSVSAVGDVNGDGFADILVGAFLNDGGATNAGAAYVIFGRSNSTNVAPTATNLSAAETYTEDTTLNLSDIVVSDPDSASVSATLTLSSAAAGALSTAGGGSYNAGTGVWSVSGTVAVVNAALAAVTFVPTANYNLGFTIATSVSDGVAAAITGSKVFTAVPVDDPPVAVADTASVAENASVAIAVLTNDTDVDTGTGATGGGAGTKAVASVNGVALTSGQSTTLASGAIVTLNANGTLGYNPNGKFDYLPSAAVAASTGASNSATDTFGYTLNGGSATTVTVTVTGVASGGSTDHLPGSSGNDTITGPNTATYFDLSQGGNDTATGGSGNDGFFLGAAFTGADRLDGGGGTNNQVGLQGDYTGGNALVLQAGTITNIQSIVALGGSSYSITTVDANLAAGQNLAINAAQLGTGDSFTFNGAAETNGSFTVFGGLGADTITTGGGNDGIYFGAGRFNVATDHVDGGAGNDQLALDGTYTGLTIARANLVNVEMLVLLDGQPAPVDYSITLADDWTQGAEVHTVYGVTVRHGFTVDGHLETSSMLRFYGGAGADTLSGGAAGNWFDGGAGGDTMTGGAGVDTYYYGSAATSTSVNYDRIVTFNPGQDQIDVPGTVSAIDAARTGALSTASFDSDLTAALATLGANHAVQFTATSGTLATHVFEVIDVNGVAGYQAGQDLVIELVTPTAAITTTTPFV